MRAQIDADQQSQAVAQCLAVRRAMFRERGLQHLLRGFGVAAAAQLQRT